MFYKNSRRLITTYPIPIQYLPVSNYEISKGIISMAGKINSNLDDFVIIYTKNNIVHGCIINECYPQ